MSKNAFVYTGYENLEAMGEAKNYNNFLIRIIANSGINKDSLILDFGAGRGTYADMLVSNGYNNVHCLEPDATLQKILKSKKLTIKSSIPELGTDKYDCVYALNVMEHIENDEEVIVKLSSALKPGGRMVVYVPAFQILYSTMDTLVGHFRRYRKDRLRSHANRAGLTIKKLEYCDSLGFFAAFIFKYFGSKNGVITPGSVKIYDRYFFPISKLLDNVTKSIFGKNVYMVAEKTNEKK